MRGVRLWQIYHEMLRSTQQGHAKYSSEVIERAWMDMFSEDEVDWVRFLLQVLEAAYPIFGADQDTNMYGNDVEEGLDQDHGEAGQ